MKRLLAWSSIENVGILFTGVGLAIVFSGVGMQPLASLALVAVLYHAVNHAFMKSLLFVGTGSVLHATHERNLGKLGGLIRRMPWVAWLTLVGALAIAGCRRSTASCRSGCCSRRFCPRPRCRSRSWACCLPLGAALVALAAALAGYVMVKFYGVIFLGQPREPALESARDADTLERVGLGWLATGCVVLGLLPRPFISFLELVPMQLGLIEAPTIGGAWWRVVPVMERQAAYAPAVFLLVVALAIALTVLLVRRFYHVRARRAAPWDCGFARLDARMQDTAEGFGQPIRHIFQPFFRDAPRAAIAVRHGAALPRYGRRSDLDVRLSADRRARAARRASGRVASAGQDRDVPSL